MISKNLGDYKLKLHKIFLMQCFIFDYYTLITKNVKIILVISGKPLE